VLGWISTWFDKKPEIPRWARVWTLVAIVVVVQALAYKQLADNPPMVLRTPAPPAPVISRTPPEAKKPAEPAAKPVAAKTQPPTNTKPSVIQDCPNGICAGGDISGSPTVNNYGPLLPQISWKIDDKTPLPKTVTHPGVWVSISIDRPFLDAKFAVLCDHPCSGVGSQMVTAHGGYVESSWGTLPEAGPNVAAFVVSAPNPMSADDGLLACVQSEDEDPVKVVAVKTLTIKKPSLTIN
jgi:hypothetical protein